MARTWRPIAAPSLSHGDYSVSASTLTLGTLKLPIEAAVGGPRHGISFLARLKELPLPRAPLIEGRYLASHTGPLVLSPGLPEETPQSLETAIGRVLSPTFEKKCLTCHGAPTQGVTCESCHGPGDEHVKGKLNAIVRPRTTEQVLQVCGKCHTGFGELVDPPPHDVLISNQVTAIRNSECFIQSGRGFNCLACHDPHRNARAGDPAYNRTCTNCHASKPAACAADCVSCHMPKVQHGSFKLVDHWIRAPRSTGAWRPTRPPLRAFLKIIVVEQRELADRIAAELHAGAPFFDLARKRSIDPSRGSGGFLGDTDVSTMQPELAAAVLKLAPGETSPVVPSRGKFVILARAPRDFRWRANELVRDASATKSIARLEAALRINPHSARAIVLLGVAVGEQGDRARAVAVLRHATLLHPKDPSAHYNLGIAYGAVGRADEEIASYRRALDLEPDLVPAWQNLGAALLSAGRTEEAAAAFERGLDVNPLSAILHYNLGLARRAQGRLDEAARAFDVARKIDPRMAAPPQP